MITTSPSLSIRTYGGEQAVHAHDHAQVMFAWRGRMELEIGAQAGFADSSCGLVIPAGTTHAFSGSPALRMVVIDARDDAGLDRVRRFPVTAAVRQLVDSHDAARLLAAILDVPRAGVRRGIELDMLDAALRQALHAPWTNADMAAVYRLSPQRFHARWLELTGETPQARLRGLRLDEAQRLLRRGLTLDATALRVGYRSGSALAQALRRERDVRARGLRAE